MLTHSWNQIQIFFFPIFWHYETDGTEQVWYRQLNIFVPHTSYWLRIDAKSGSEMAKNISNVRFEVSTAVTMMIIIL
jgi:hypothetical protein